MSFWFEPSRIQPSPLSTGVRNTKFLHSRGSRMVQMFPPRSQLSSKTISYKKRARVSPSSGEGEKEDWIFSDHNNSLFLMLSGEGASRKIKSERVGDTSPIPISTLWFNQSAQCFPPKNPFWAGLSLEDMLILARAHNAPFSKYLRQKKK